MSAGDGGSSIQAMQALSAAQRVMANNVANVSTEGFAPSRVHMEDGPGGEGVAVAAVKPVNAAAPVGRNAQTMVDEFVRLGPGREAGEPSGTDLSREMVNLIVNERSFAANASFFRNLNDMLGFVMDMKA
ncbi:MAG: flagellar basal body protein [Proteobacteria bacterium]|nr:flagellar basal body protein [Pseudomonadota bacterium]